MPRHNGCEGPLCHLIAHAYGREFPWYPKDTLFTKAQLLELHPQHIHNWLAYKAFRKTAFSLANGDRPVHMRSSQLFLDNSIGKVLVYKPAHRLVHVRPTGAGHEATARLAGWR